jgi:hypothetical protein
MKMNRFRGGFNVALQWLVGWLRRLRRPRYCIAWDIGLKDSFSVVTKLRSDGSVEWVQVVDHKPANDSAQVSSEAR